MKTQFIIEAANAIAQTILANENTLESLDREIGDGDHYINMKRGATTIVEMQTDLVALKPDEALNKIGMKLLSTIGGASGPLLASFFISMAKVLKENGDESVSSKEVLKFKDELEKAHDILCVCKQQNRSNEMIAGNKAVSNF